MDEDTEALDSEDTAAPVTEDTSENIPLQTPPPQTEQPVPVQTQSIAQKENDSYYMLHADGMAILQNAPDLQTGMQLLGEAYQAKDWDDPDKARDLVSQYAQDLRYRFGDLGRFQEAEIGKLEPVRFSEVEAEGADDKEKNLNRIDNWVKMNKAVLAKSDDLTHILNRTKLEKSLDDTALKLKRYARYGEGNTVLNATEDAFVRLVEGATAAPSELLFGRENAYVKALKEHTDPAYDDDYGTAILGGIGMLGGTLASGGAGVVASGSYLAASGAGAIRSKYQEALEVTGDEHKAAQAAAVETVAQGIMLGGVGKIANTTRRALGKTVEKISEPLFKRIINPVITGVGTQVVGGEGSQVSEAIATGQDYHFDPDAALKRATLGAVFGAVGAAGEVMRPSVKPDPLIENGGIPKAEEKSIIGGVEAHEMPEAITIGKSKATELQLSEQFKQIEDEQSKWTPEQKEAAQVSYANMREASYLESRIDDLMLRKKKAPTDEAKQQIQDLIDRFQEDRADLAMKLGENIPGVEEAKTLQEKELLASRLKELKGRAGVKEGGTPLTHPETIPPEAEDLSWGEGETLPVNEGFLGTEEVPQAIFYTKDGSVYQGTPFGSLARTKDGKSYYAPDNTFYVDQETANTLGLTRDYVAKNGNAVRLFTDGHRLLVRGTNGEVNEVPILPGPVVGAHPVEVNIPKKAVRETKNSPDSIEYRSFIGQEITNVQGLEPKPTGDKSAGAMELTAIPPRRIGERLAQSKALDENIKQAFGDPELPIDRYFPSSNFDTKTEAGKMIAEKGIPKATADYLESQPEVESRLRVEQGHQLLMAYNQAAKAAKAMGDLASYERYSSLAIDIGKRAEEIATDLGQGVQAHVMWKDLDPDIRVVGLRGKLNEQALREVASKEGYTVEDMQTTLKLEKQVNDDIAGLKKIQEAEGQLSEAQRARLTELEAKKAQIQDLQNKIASAKKIKQKVLTEADEKSLTSLMKIFPSLKQGTTPYLKVIEAIQKITNKVTPPSRSQMLGFWMANTLSGPATHIINILNTGLHVADTSVDLALSGRPDLGWQFIQGMISSIPEAAGGAFRTFTTGEAKSRVGAEDAKFQTRSDFVKEGYKGFRYLGYALRALSAEDEFFYHNAKEGYAKAAAYWNAKKSGLSGEALRQKVASDLNQSPEAWTEAQNEALGYAKALKDQTGIELTDAQIKNTTWELMESKRPDLLQKDSHRFSLAQTFNGPQTGFIGYVTKALMTMTEAPVTIAGRQIRPLRYITPFLRIGGALANAFTDYAGAGYVKALMSKELVVNSLRKPELVEKPALQQKVELGRAILGTVTTGILYGLAREFIDDKDPYFAIYGPGPKDADKVAQLKQQKNWMPYSIKIGETLIPFKWTPYVFPLGAIGAIHDKVRWSKQYAKADERNAISILTAGALGAFADNSYLKTLGDVIGILQDEPGKSVEDIPINVGKGFIPGSAALRAISNIVDNPIVTKHDLWAKIISGIPVAQGIGTKPTLNVFGEPIPRTMAERMSVNRLWNTETDDPDFQWLAHNGYDLPDAGSTDIKLGTTGRKSIQEKRAQNYGPILEGRLTPDERYQLTETSGPDIRKVVSKYRQRYGNAGFSQRVQDQLKNDIASVRNRWKRRLFLH